MVLEERLAIYHATCPECGSADTIYIRSGDELVCRDCLPGLDADRADSRDYCKHCDAVLVVTAVTGDGWGVRCDRGHEYVVPDARIV